MIYQDNTTGTFLIKNDMTRGQKLTIGYKVKNAKKEIKIDYTDLPRVLQNKLARVTNQIARYVEEENL